MQRIYTIPLPVVVQGAGLQDQGVTAIIDGAQ